MTRRALVAILTAVLASSVVFTQPGRGGSQWLTALADAQRTSWIRADDKVSVATMSKPGFELQWKSKLDNQPRGLQGLAQGVSASGVTLFVPMTLVAGSSNNLYAIDLDTRMSRRDHRCRDTHRSIGRVSNGGCCRIEFRSWCGRLSQSARRTGRRCAAR